MINYAKACVLYPCIQVYVNSCESSSGKSLFGAPTPTSFNIVIHQDTLIGAFNRSPGLELLFECLCVSWSIGIYKFPKKFLYWELERGFPFPV